MLMEEILHHPTQHETIQIMEYLSIPIGAGFLPSTVVWLRGIIYTVPLLMEEI